MPLNLPPKSSTPKPLVLATFAFVLAAASCGGSSTTTSKTMASQSVGATGGSLSLADGTKLVIPAGALTTTSTITIGKSTSAVPAGYNAESALYVFGPSGLTFAKPVAVTLPVNAGASSPSVYWSNPSGGFDELGGTASTGAISASVTHFSEGFVAQAGAGTTDGGADATTGAAGSAAGTAGGGTAGGGTAGTTAADGAAGSTAPADGAAGTTTPVDGAAGSTAPTDGGADTIVTTDADGGAFVCGASPTDPLVLGVGTSDSSKPPITITSSDCVGKALQPDKPKTTINFTDGVATWVHAVAAGAYLPAYWPELKPTAGYTDSIDMFVLDTATVAAKIPNYNAATMAILDVGTLVKSTTAPCNVDTGVTYTVPGHAEATTVYQDEKLGTFITLVPTSALEYVTIVGTKTGCAVQTSGYVFTGRIPVSAGTSSLGLGVLLDP
jgi:ZU5 domain